MDEDWYVIEIMIRSRLAEAQARARFTAQIGQPNEHSPRPNSTGSRLINLARSLVSGLRGKFSNRAPGVAR